MHPAAQFRPFLRRALSPDVPVRPDCIAAKWPSGVNLAFMPIVRGLPSKEGTQYWAGEGSWLPDEGSTKSLFSTCYYWTSLSAGRIAGLDKWILLYQLQALQTSSKRHITFLS